GPPVSGDWGSLPVGGVPLLAPALALGLRQFDPGEQPSPRGETPKRRPRIRPAYSPLGASSGATSVAPSAPSAPLAPPLPLASPSGCARCTSCLPFGSLVVTVPGRAGVVSVIGAGHSLAGVFGFASKQAL